MKLVILLITLWLVSFPQLSPIKKPEGCQCSRSRSSHVNQGDDLTLLCLLPIVTFSESKTVSIKEQEGTIDENWKKI